MNKQDLADEALFLLLHNEMVSCVYKSSEQGDATGGNSTAGFPAEFPPVHACIGLHYNKQSYGNDRGLSA
ncbi:hypothetical protein GDO78_015640 [Eleutherodactylus coqui]|uniref:Uncharacterized protein n=1 Tax=Eleutherodactylus coqui TaxID=57060 RepID=A0A8J6B5L9_ELECQ|nr:hypothetical protein GDO78_015640 [Eleutherodactylus coqui]